MRWNIGTKMSASFAVALAALAVLGIVSYRTTAGLVENAGQVNHTFRVLNELGALLSSLQDVETGERGFVITGEDSFLEPYTKSIGVVHQNLEATRSLTSDNLAQQRRIDTLGTLIDRQLSILAENVRLRRSSGFETAQKAVLAGSGKKVMDDIRAVMKEMQDEELSLMKQRDARATASVAALRGVSVFGTIAVFVIVVFAAARLVRSINRPMRDGVTQLSSSSAEILAMTSQVAASSAETATAVAQTTTTVEEVKQTAHVSLQKARAVSESAQQMVRAAQAGNDAVAEAIAGMQLVREQVEALAGSIVRLSEQSQTVGEIIATVNDLADQSNLLAVNAAIEAAKAGEHGRGFAVVAQEIRSLADQSKQATAQIRSILGDIQKAISAAVMATEQGSKAVDRGVQQSGAAGEAIEMLAGSVTQASQSATQIAASSQQQLAGMDQVALAMASIQQSTTQNVAGTKQAEIAAQSLAELGRRLRVMVEGRPA